MISAYLSWARRILIRSQNALLDQFLGFRSSLDLMLETIFAHVFFELAPIGLETGGCGRVGEDVACLLFCVSKGVQGRGREGGQVGW